MSTHNIHFVEKHEKYQNFWFKKYALSRAMNNIFLTFSTLGKKFSRLHFEIFFLFFPENRIWHFMQIVSIEENLHKMSKSFFSRKKN